MFLTKKKKKKIKETSPSTQKEKKNKTKKKQQTNKKKTNHSVRATTHGPPHPQDNHLTRVNSNHNIKPGTKLTHAPNKLSIYLQRKKKYAYYIHLERKKALSAKIIGLWHSVEWPND